MFKCDKELDEDHDHGDDVLFLDCVVLVGVWKAHLEGDTLTKGDDDRDTKDSAWLVGVGVSGEQKRMLRVLITFS